jgi:CII-binding regulator of phage lambda lysogenization HflD
MVGSVVGAVVDKALGAVLRKVGEGKKLSTEDLVVLMLGLFQGIRKDVTETNKRIDALYDLVGKIYDLMGKNYEALNKRIDEVNRRIDETNKRIDTLYDLLGKIYQTLIKGTTTQRQ